MNSTNNNENILKNAKIELNHLKEIKNFRRTRNEIENLIDELKFKSKSINWKYLENISMNNNELPFISEIEVYCKIFALDVINEKFRKYDKLLINNIKSLIDDYKAANDAAEALIQMNSLSLTMENYTDDNDNSESDVDEGFPLTRTHGRIIQGKATPIPEKRYNLRPRK